MKIWTILTQGPLAEYWVSPLSNGTNSNWTIESRLARQAARLFFFPAHTVLSTVSRLDNKKSLRGMGKCSCFLKQKKKKLGCYIREVCFHVVRLNINGGRYDQKGKCLMGIEN